MKHWRPAVMLFACLLATGCSRAPEELQPCVACAGTGLVTSEVWRQQTGKTEAPAAADGTHPCSVCQGRGQVPR